MTERPTERMWFNSGLERAARIAEGGSFLHMEAPSARFGKECAAAIRREISDHRPMRWAALHRADTTELTKDDAPGYRRAPWSENGFIFGDAMEDWGWVVFISLWDAPDGGNVLSDPPLQSAHGDIVLSRRYSAHHKDF